MKGVSISKNPCDKVSRIAIATLCRARCCPAWRRGADRCSDTSAASLRWSAPCQRAGTTLGLNSFRMRISSATTSTSPVGIFLLMVSASRFFTVPGHSNDVFIADSIRLYHARRYSTRGKIEDNLGHTAAVAQINEDDVAKIAAGATVPPFHERGFFACIGEAQSAAHVASSKVA